MVHVLSVNIVYRLSFLKQIPTKNIFALCTLGVFSKYQVITAFKKI